MNESETVGSRAKRAREAAGITQEEAATRSGIHVQTISRIERDQAREPAADTIARLARAYGISSEELLVGSSAEPEPEPSVSAEFLWGISEGVMYSCQRVSRELHDIIQDTRAEIRRRRWQPPEGDLRTRDAQAATYRQPRPLEERLEALERVAATLRGTGPAAAGETAPAAQTAE